MDAAGKWENGPRADFRAARNIRRKFRGGDARLSLLVRRNFSSRVIYNGLAVADRFPGHAILNGAQFDRLPR